MLIRSSSHKNRSDSDWRACRTIGGYTSGRARTVEFDTAVTPATTGSAVDPDDPAGFGVVMPLSHQRKVLITLVLLRRHAALLPPSRATVIATPLKIKNQVLRPPLAPK
jgi:hypothetical protein